ncbi:hypothetical protein M426DRAFT_9504 [Hypoxylon sp. CI-4A]|nr:hypothetical protein M426DRAFT_9504 [Hypoxylon sp. CI-4A]
MSDQQTNAVEGIQAPVENHQAITPDTEGNGQQVADIKTEDNVKVEDVKTGENGVKNGEAQQATSGDAVQASNKKAKGEKKVWIPKNPIPRLKDLPEGILKVNRHGSEHREKFDPSVLPVSDDPEAIRWQVHFYFSDSNLPDDKFLWEKTGQSENKPVPLSLICSFSRMRRFKPYSAVVNALKTSDFVVVEGPEGEETVRRKEPCIPEADREEQIIDRSTYIKGFGEEKKTMQFDIEEFLRQYGEINAVRLRRSDDGQKVFKGSVQVEWVDEDTAHEFFDLNPKPRWKDHLLQIIPWDSFKVQKAEEDAEKERKRQKDHGFRGQRGGKSNGGNRQGPDANDWKKRRDNDQKNGFSDRRGRRDYGGRGRGRGRGRGQGGNNRGGRDHGNGRTDEQPTPRKDEKPTIHTSKEGLKIIKEQEAHRDAETNGKRARDDDDSADAPPSKKINA